MDLLTDSFDEPVDYVFANHFLHHLASEEIIHLILRWKPLVRHRMVFSDLQRDRGAYLGFSALSRFYRNSFTWVDGLISIRRGFQPKELAALADAATSNCDFTVHRLLPGRLVLCIDGNPMNTG